MTNVLLTYILSALWGIIALLQKDPTLSLMAGWISTITSIIAVIALLVHLFREKK